MIMDANDHVKTSGMCSFFFNLWRHEQSYICEALGLACPRYYMLAQEMCTQDLPIYVRKTQPMLKSSGIYRVCRAERTWYIFFDVGEILPSRAQASTSVTLNY